MRRLRLTILIPLYRLRVLGTLNEHPQIIVFSQSINLERMTQLMKAIVADFLEVSVPKSVSFNLLRAHVSDL